MAHGLREFEDGRFSAMPCEVERCGKLVPAYLLKMGGRMSNSLITLGFMDLFGCSQRN